MVLGIGGVPAGAGMTFKDLILHERITLGDGAPYEETQFFSGSKSVRDDPQQRTIVDLEAKTIMVLRKGAKLYSVTRLEDVRREDEQQKARLASLPTEARKSLGFAAPVTLKPTGQTQKIAGYKAKEYTIAGGGMGGTVWVTDAINPGPGAYAWENSAGLTGGPRGGPGGTLAEALVKLKGLPLRTALTVGSGPGRVKTTIEVLRVEEKAPAADVFAVPPDYRIGSTP